MAWVDELRRELPNAFESAVEAIPPAMQKEADRMAERIVEHVTGTWKPNL